MRLKNALLIAVPATALMTMPVVAQTYGDHPHMGAWGWGGMILGPIMMIVFIAVAVVVVVLLVRWLGGPHGGALHGLPGKTPLDILKERFAEGEIDKEEFEERQRVLTPSGRSLDSAIDVKVGGSSRVLTYVNLLVEETCYGENCNLF